MVGLASSRLGIVFYVCGVLVYVQILFPTASSWWSFATTEFLTASIHKSTAESRRVKSTGKTMPVRHRIDGRGMSEGVKYVASVHDDNRAHYYYYTP